MAVRRLEVQFVGDTSGLEKENRKLQRDLTKLRKEFDDTGKSGQSFGSDTDRVGKQIDKASVAAKRLGADIKGLGRDTDSTHKQIAKFAGDFGGRGLTGNITEMTASLGPLRGGLSGVVAIAATLGPVMLAAGGATIALGAALGPLVGLAGAGAVALTAFAQAGLAVALAATGVKDALTEQLDKQSKVGKAVTKGADQQRTAARAIAAAQDGVVSAQDRVRSATENLTRAEDARREALKALGPAQAQAKRELQDMHSSLASAALTERSAVMALEDARKGLAEAMSPNNADKLASAQATLTASTRAEDRAVRDLADARQRLDELMQPADALTVADAEDAVSDALRDETRAALALKKAREDAAKVLADPTSTDDDKARAKLDLADAENAVGDATRASTHAQQALAKVQAGPDPKDVAKAKQDIADAEQGVADATNATVQAHKDLLDASKGADPAAVAKATLEVATAEQALADATRDHARLAKDVLAADKAGIEGSDAVVSARERIADASRAVIEADRTLKDSQKDVAKAMEAVRDAQIDAHASAAALATSAVDLDEKFNKLPPAAQAFVKQLVAMKPKMDTLRSTAAAGLFPGVTAGLVSAAKNFDPLNRVIGLTAETIGKLASRAGDLIGSKGFGKDFETIGGRNALIIDRLGRAAIYLFDAFRHLLVAAGPLTTWLAKSTVEWARNVDEAAKAGRESGKLGDFFQKTGNTLKTVVSILGNLGGAFFDVGKAAAPFGRDTLGAIDKVSGKFKEWTESVGGQKALQDFFKQSNSLMKEFIPAIADASKSLGGLAFSVLPAYAKILQVLGPLAGPLVQAFVLYKVAATGAAIATGLFTAASKLQAAAMWVTKDALIVTRVQLGLLAVQEKAAAVATGVMTAAQWLLNAAMSANPIVLVGIALAALVAGIVIAYKKSETFREIVDALWGAIKTAAGAVWDFITSLTDLPGKIYDAGKAMTEGLISGIKALPGLLADAATWLWGKLKAGIEAYGEAYRNAGKWVLEKITDGIKAVAGAVTGAAKWIFDTLKGGIDALAAFFTNRGKDVLGWIVTGITTATTALAGVAGFLVGELKTGFTAATAFFANRGEQVLGYIVGGITTVTDALTGIGDWLVKQLKAGFAVVEKGITGIGGTIMGWIISGLKTGAYELQGFLNKIIDLVNKIPGVDIGHISALKKDAKTGEVTGFARGGAYARTGGYVDQPMTFMGEEAPRHPEFVIPTNPAYRRRAQMLLGKAAGAIGLARGGVHAFAEGGINQYNHVFPAHHIDEPGFRMDPDDVMAIAQKFGLPGRPFEQIAHGESDYHPGVIQRDPGDGMVGYGMWQMTPNAWGDAGRAKLAQLGGIAQMLNPFKNAEMAKVLYDAGGLGQWYGTKYLGQDGSADKGGGFLDGIKSALGSAFDLLKDGASALLGKLPSADGLGWLKGLGSNVLGDVSKWIKEKALGLIGGGGGSGAASGVAGLGTFDGRQVAKWIIPELKYARAHGWDGPITSAYRPPDQVVTGPVVAPQGKSEHQGTQYPHGAVDFGGPFDAAGLANKQAFMAAVAGYKGQKLIPAQGFRDDGHMSGTGHATGGVFGGLPFLGKFHDGGVAPVEGIAHVAAREVMTPEGQHDGGMEVRVVIEDNTTRVFVNGEEQINAVIDRRERAEKGRHRAGVS